MSGVVLLLVRAGSRTLLSLCFILAANEKLSVILAGTGCKI